MAGTGAKTPATGDKNVKSVVASKNDMGGSSANIVKGGSEQAADGKPVPKPNNQYTKGQGNLQKFLMLTSSSLHILKRLLTLICLTTRSIRSSHQWLYLLKS